AAGEGASQVDVYLLVEHQSEPDDLASYRALRYLGAAFDLQLRDWLKAHRNNPRGFKFHPVLPVVVYTGSRSWKRLLRIEELVQHAELVKGHLPSLDPV